MKFNSNDLPWEFPGAHWIDSREEESVQAVIRSKGPFRYYGPDLQHKVDQLESSVCDLLSTPYALAVNSGSAALHIVLSAWGVGPGDEVLLPGYLWVSCISAIVRLGAIPNLVDIDDTFCMDPNDLNNKINSRTRAIIYVHMSGASGHIDQITKIAKQNDIFLLEDCAQAMGARFHNQYLGTFGDAGIFSFQLNKNITGGEGGMIVCKNENLYHRCFAVHDLGYVRDKKGRLDTDNPDIQMWGIGARMSEITGAFILAQLHKINEITGSMNRSKWAIRSGIENIQHITFREIIDPQGDSGAFLITTYPSQAHCLSFFKQLEYHGVHGPPGSLLCLPMSEWGLHWYFNNHSLVNRAGLNQEGFPWTHPKNKFAIDYTYDKGTLPVCDDKASRSIILSIPSCLTSAQTEFIIDAFKKSSRALFK